MSLSDIWRQYKVPIIAGLAGAGTRYMTGDQSPVKSWKPDEAGGWRDYAPSIAGTAAGYLATKDKDNYGLSDAALHAAAGYGGGRFMGDVRGQKNIRAAAGIGSIPWGDVNREIGTSGMSTAGAAKLRSDLVRNQFLGGTAKAGGNAGVRGGGGGDDSSVWGWMKKYPGVPMGLAAYAVMKDDEKKDIDKLKNQGKGVEEQPRRDQQNRYEEQKIKWEEGDPALRAQYKTLGYLRVAYGLPYKPPQQLEGLQTAADGGYIQKYNQGGEVSGPPVTPGGSTRKHYNEVKRYLWETEGVVPDEHAVNTTMKKWGLPTSPTAESRARVRDQAMAQWNPNQGMAEGGTPSRYAERGTEGGNMEEFRNIQNVKRVLSEEKVNLEDPKSFEDLPPDVLEMIAQALDGKRVDPETTRQLQIIEHEDRVRRAENIKAYWDDLRKRGVRDEAYGYSHGGYASGPGGPKSDDIPAMLSDGEFVMTADAVDGAGGPEAMYSMMDMFEGRG